MIVREMSYEEYLAGIKAEVHEKGLRSAVVERLNEIVDESMDLGYMGNAFVMEKATEILDLLKMQDNEMQYRTPKKVEHKATIYKCCTCPTCGNVVGSFEQWENRQVRITVDFCQFCGQKLDWSDEFEEGVMKQNE